MIECERFMKMIEFEKFKSSLHKMQYKTATNTLWYGEHIRLRHCKHQNSWGRITQLIEIRPKTHNISQWNKCSTHLRNWYRSNQIRSVEWIQFTGIFDHWSVNLWLFMKKSFVSFTPRSPYSKIMYCVSEKCKKNLQSNSVWENKLTWFKSSSQHSFGLNRWWVAGIRVWYLSSIHHIAALHKIQELLQKLSITTAKWTGRLLSSHRCSMISHGDLRKARVRVKCHLLVCNK